MIEDDRIFNDGVWHDIAISYSGEVIRLTVDDQKDSKSTRKAASLIQLSGNLCFGSREPIRVELLGVNAHAFVGSLGSLIELNDDLLDILEDSVDGVNIGNPDSSSCDPYVCNSNGQCKESQNGFDCECYFSYQGETCEQGKDFVY